MLDHFDAVSARDGLIKAVQNLAKEQGFSKVVIGISGGKDSTVSAALCARALGKENVYGVMLPDGEQKDISDSRKVCESLGINYKTVNIGGMHAALKENVGGCPAFSCCGEETGSTDHRLPDPVQHK